MSYDLRDLTYSGFAEKIAALAEQEKVGAQVMIGACLLLLRGLYATLPIFIKRDFIDSLHRFAAELEHQNPTVRR